jgi:hypothetical protein
VYTTQVLIVALLGLSLVALVIRLSRGGLLSFRYTIGWLAVAIVGIFSSLFIPLAQPIALSLGLSAAALVAVVALMLFVLISLQISISISGLQKQVQTLSEEVALLKLEVASGD